MDGISLSYWNELSNQLMLISSLMCGFSVAVVVTLLIHNSTNKILGIIFKLAVFSALAFLLSIFSTTTIKMMTTQGYPLKFDEAKFSTTRIIAGFGFLTGILSIISILSLSGWVKTKRTGWLTTILGILSFILFLLVI